MDHNQVPLDAHSGELVDVVITAANTITLTENFGTVEGVLNANGIVVRNYPEPNQERPAVPAVHQLVVSVKAGHRVACVKRQEWHACLEMFVVKNATTTGARASVELQIKAATRLVPRARSLYRLL